MSPSRERILDVLNSLPAVEIETGGERSQHVGASVRKKRFAWYLDDHQGAGIVAITCKAARGVNTAMVDSDQGRYFIPSYTGHRGWIGIRLDVDDIDWDRVEIALLEAYRMTAPSSLSRQLDAG